MKSYISSFQTSVSFLWAEEMVAQWLVFINDETEAGQSMHFLNIMPLQVETVVNLKHFWTFLAKAYIIQHLLQSLAAINL